MPLGAENSFQGLPPTACWNCLKKGAKGALDQIRRRRVVQPKSAALNKVGGADAQVLRDAVDDAQRLRDDHLKEEVHLPPPLVAKVAKHIDEVHHMKETP